MLSGLSEIPTNHFFIQIRLHFIHSFISTHPRRVWQMSWQTWLSHSVFQSTHPRRVWPVLSIFNLFAVDVSIHTPTKGVTKYCHITCFITFVSIHTPTKGVTAYRKPLSSHFSFQSTHPRRVWRSAQAFPVSLWQFQSTHPRRVWPIGCKLEIRVLQFQSTHPRRVWPHHHLYINL